MHVNILKILMENYGYGVVQIGFFVGIALATGHLNALLGLRKIVIAAFSIILPLVCIALLITTPVLYIHLFTGNLLQFTQESSLQSVLIIATIVLLLAINAYHEDGRYVNEGNRWLRMTWRFGLFLGLAAALLCNIVFYETNAAVDISSGRYISSFLLACLVVYFASYCVAFTLVDKQSAIARVNKVLVWLVLGASILMASPLYNLVIPPSADQASISVPPEQVSSSTDHSS